MNGIPLKPAQLFAEVVNRVTTAMGIDPAWVFLTPAPELLGKLPPASGVFAAVIPSGITFPESPQHQQFCPADVRFDVAVFARVALDRGLDGKKLLIDERGLFPTADKIVTALAGDPFETASGQLLRGPMQCLGMDAIRWAEGQNIVLAYMLVRFTAPILYHLE